MLSQLRKLGFSEKEAKVYLAALELGAETAQEISRKAGVNRATTYVILQILIKRGLASTFEKGKKTFFAAESPDQIDHLLRKQSEEIFEQRRDLERIIPELRALNNLAENKPKVRFFEGRDGILSMYEEVYRKASRESQFYEFLSLDKALAVFPDYPSTSMLQRLKRNIAWQVIYTSRDGPQAYFDDPKIKSFAKHLKPEKYPFETSILIAPELNWVVISSFSRGLSGVIIENPELAKTMESMFHFMWDTL